MSISLHLSGDYLLLIFQTAHGGMLEDERIEHAQNFNRRSEKHIMYFNRAFNHTCKARLIVGTNSRRILWKLEEVTEGDRSNHRMSCVVIESCESSTSEKQ